ncbi:hypothetical protein QTL86_09060 [Cellulosilyticum sp. ST5]|uniref:hypothetical protein n=1 Tax=Cellulosilyticum sp. ST5 TaxID=3055805 RepID=UPI0039773DF5
MIKKDGIKSPYANCGEESKTTPGYVYLTNDIMSAIYFGENSAFISKCNKGIIVFEIEMSKEDLEIDEDEKKTRFNIKKLARNKKEILTIEDSLEILKAVRVGKDIDLKCTAAKYAICESCRMKAIEIGDKVRKEENDIELYEELQVKIRVIKKTYKGIIKLDKNESNIRNAIISSIKWKMVECFCN